MCKDTKFSLLNKRQSKLNAIIITVIAANFWKLNKLKIIFKKEYFCLIINII